MDLRPLRPRPTATDRPAASPPGLPPDLSRAALLPLVLVGGVVVWWGWKAGAYFDVVFLPGAMALMALGAALAALAPWPGRLGGAARVALFSLIALAAWTLASALWSPTEAVAISDAQRVLTYALAFGLGAWLCLLLGRRMLLAAAPVAAGGAIVAVATLIALWVGDNAVEFFEEDATLRYPLGYRNAEAAFFLIAAWPMLALAAARQVDWRARAALLGAATLAIELAILSQSRAALFAAIVGAAALIAAHPAHLRMVGYLCLASLPAVLALPWLLDVYQADGGQTEASLDPLRTACAAMAVSSLASVVIGALVARTDPVLSPPAHRVVGRVLLGVVAVGALAGVLALARADGGPTGFVSDHVDQLTQGTPSGEGEQSRFGLDLRSDRGELWRVAIDEFEADPIAGLGAGGFRAAYLLDRRAIDVQPEDPHGVELLMASELGVPGLALFAAFAIAALVAILRARRLGPAAGALAAAGLAAGAYWLVQASVDWFWNYPGITLPVAFLLGTAAAPALLRPPAPPRRGRRVALAAACLLAAGSFIPFYLSERLTKDALQGGSDDLTETYEDLERAADLNPWSDRPLIAEAVIAERAGEPQRALAALSAAQERTPTEWTLYFLEARVLEPIDPAAARRAIIRARELNPYGAELNRLEAQLGIER